MRIRDLSDRAERELLNGCLIGIALFKTGAEFYKVTALPTEAFAHMFCATIQNHESLALIKKYFPKSYGVFEEMIEAFLQEELRKWIGKNSTERRLNMKPVLKMFCRRSKCLRETSTTR